MLNVSCCLTGHLQAQCRFLTPPRPNPQLSRPRNKTVVSCAPKGRGLAPVLALMPVYGSADNGGLGDRLKLRSMTKDGLSYKEKFIVRCFEVGINKNVTIETIANLLQEVGCNHAEYVTMLKTPKMNMRWMTARMHIEMYRYPAWGDAIEIETSCQGEGVIGTRRDWILKDSVNHQVIGRASRLAFSEEFNSSIEKMSKLEDPATYSRKGIKPRRADLDMNQHVNIVKYIVWVIESVPQYIIDNYELQAITLYYRRECQQGDVVDSLTSPDADSDTEMVSEYEQRGREDCERFLHLLRSSDGQEINRGRTEWRKRGSR